MRHWADLSPSERRRYALAVNYDREPDMPHAERCFAWEEAECEKLRRARPGPHEDATMPPAETECLSLISASQVRVRPVRWLVPGYIPGGKLFMLAGDGGHGKSTLTLDLAARLSRGQCALGLRYENAVRGESILIGREDDYSDTVVPRLVAAGADPAQVHLLKQDGDARPFNIQNYRALEYTLAALPAVRLAVIDPAGAYVGAAKVDDYKESELRALLAPLAELAARRNVTIVLVKHFVKGATAKAVYKVGGSVGYVNTVRAAFVVVPSAQDVGLKLFLPMKGNLTKVPAGRSFRRAELPAAEKCEILRNHADHLEAADQDRLAEQLFRVEWVGPVDVTADEALADVQKAEKNDPTRAARCAAWMKDFLRQYAYPSPEIVDAAKKAGFTFDNVKTARESLRPDGIVSRKRGHQGEWWTGFGPPDQWIDRPSGEGQPATG